LSWCEGKSGFKEGERKKRGWETFSSALQGIAASKGYGVQKTSEKKKKTVKVRKGDKMENEKKGGWGEGKFF